MSTKDRAIVARWRGRLRIRKRLLAAARRRHTAAPTNATRSLVNRRKRQVAEAERVIARRVKRRHVSAPVDPILEDSWGWRPGVHDGIDVMARYKDDVVAMCDAVVVRVSAGGWWGKGARPTNGHPISHGDGIIILRSLTDEGPFFRGLLIAYGHTEGAVVKVGQKVRAGQKIGEVGWANGPHIHLMIRGKDSTPAFIEGVGDRDPRPFLNYAVKHSR